MSHTDLDRTIREHLARHGFRAWDRGIEQYPEVVVAIRNLILADRAARPAVQRETTGGAAGNQQGKGSYHE